MAKGPLKPFLANNVQRFRVVKKSMSLGYPVGIQDDNFKTDEVFLIFVPDA